MEFGVFFCPEKNFTEYVEAARLAEEVGFSFLGLIDLPYNYLDVYPMLTAIAGATRRLQIGPYVTNPLTRHPSVTASTMATLNVMSGGRAFLGYGRGDSAVKVLGWKPSKWKEYEQSIRDIRAWMRGDPVEVEGAPGPIAIPWAKGESEIPIDIGVFGPRGCRTAGELADVVTAECADPGTVSWLYKLSQTEAKKAGRAGIPFEVSIATFISDDLVKARGMCRYEPELLTNLIWHLMKTYPLEQLPPSLIKGFEWLADVDDWWDKHDWSKQATVAGHERITDEMVDRLCVVGSVETCIGKLRDLQNIGVERFCAYLVGSIEEIQGQLRIFGDSIIPVFSKMQSTAAKSRNQTEGTTNVR